MLQRAWSAHSRSYLLTPARTRAHPLQEDLERVRVAGRGRVDITVGSALDIFGGKLPYADVVAWHAKQQAKAH